MEGEAIQELPNLIMEDTFMHEAPASFLMLPPQLVPLQARKRAPRVYTKEEWETQKDTIEQLYQTEGKKLEEVSEFLEQNHGFYATVRQYKRRIKDWGFDTKNFKSCEMKAIVRKQRGRVAQGKMSVFEVRGRQVEPGKIERAEKRYANSRNFAAQHQSPAGPTPPDVICYTPGSGGFPEPELKDDSISRNSHRFQAGIYWPASPAPVQSPFNPFSPHESSSIRSIPGTPGTPFVMQILQMDTNDFAGESPAPIPATPGPSSDQNFNASIPDIDSNIIHANGDIDDMLLGLLNSGSNEWSFGGAAVDELPMNMNQGLIPQLPNRHEIMQPEIVLPSSRKYKERDEERCKRELDMLEEFYGSGHPRTIDTHLELGIIILSQGRFRAAELEFRKVASTSQEYRGNDHESTLRALEGLLWTIYCQSKSPFMWKLYQSLRDRAIKVLGREHMATLLISSRLALLLSDSEKWKEAELIERERYEIISRLHGREHAKTVLVAINLAITLHNLKRFEESERMMRETGRVRLELDPSDELRYTILFNSAEVRAVQGFYEESEGMFQEVIRWEKSTLGPEHPITLQSLHKLAWVLRSQGKLAESKKIYLEVLIGRTKVLGPSHPDTRQVEKVLDNWPEDQSFG